MDKTKRQKRIVQKKRNLKKWIKREEVRKTMWASGPTSSKILSEDDERRARSLANHGKRCSCHMCGNPRKHFKESSMQEKKADDEFTDDYFGGW
jgi:hypothetical protein